MPYGDDASSSENVTHLNFNVLEKIAMLLTITLSSLLNILNYYYNYNIIILSL